MAAVKRKGAKFGGGTYARRHDQGYQAVTGAVVIALAVSTLTLHHFGFGFPLVLAIAAGVVCALARVRAVVSVYVVGFVLLGGVMLTPIGGTAAPGMPLNMTPTPTSFADPNDMQYELYVLEGPSFDRPLPERSPFDSNPGRRNQESIAPENESVQLPTPHTPHIFEL